MMDTRANTEFEAVRAAAVHGYYYYSCIACVLLSYVKAPKTHIFRSSKIKFFNSLQFIESGNQK